MVGAPPGLIAGRGLKHPHCLCKLVRRWDLEAQAAKARESAERDYLAQVGERDGARVIGSREKWQRVTGGKATVEEILNAGKDPLYHLKRVGEMRRMLPADPPATLDRVKDAYEIAKAGGTHAPWMKEQLALGIRQLESAERSILKQISLHERLLENPAEKVPDWEERDQRYQAGLLKKWRQDIQRRKEQVQIIRAVLLEKRNGRQEPKL